VPCPPPYRPALAAASRGRAASGEPVTNVSSPTATPHLLSRRIDGIWHWEMAHDDGCPQYAWRRRRGATHSFAIVSDEPGKPVDADAVVEAVKALGAMPNVASIRVGRRMDLSWREMDAIDRRPER
jgi:hypothetical protein